MRRYFWLQRSAAWISCLGMLAPQIGAATETTHHSVSTGKASSSANQTDDAAPIVVDVAMAAGGTFRGQVVDRQGLPLAGTTVSIRQQQSEIASAVTDADGAFAVSRLPGGVYLVVAGPASGVYRLWAPGAAPPGANDSAMLVAGGNLVRGQGGWMYWATNPWVIGGVVAAAISIPIAVTNHNRHSGS